MKRINISRLLISSSTILDSCLTNVSATHGHRYGAKARVWMRDRGKRERERERERESEKARAKEILFIQSIHLAVIKHSYPTNVRTSPTFSGPIREATGSL